MVSWDEVIESCLLRRCHWEMLLWRAHTAWLIGQKAGSVWCANHPSCGRVLDERRDRLAAVPVNDVPYRLRVSHRSQGAVIP
jgi:hypothetical protein